MGDALALAAGVEPVAPLDAGLRLERTRPVVQPRVDHFAVVARGLEAGPGEPLEHEDAAAATCQHGRGGEPHHAGADHRDLDLATHALDPSLRSSIIPADARPCPRPARPRAPVPRPGSTSGARHTNRCAAATWVSRSAALDVRALQRELFDDGYARVGWPEALGGLGGTVLHRALLLDLLSRAGYPGRFLLEHLEILPPALAAHAPPALTEELFLPTLRGDILWCQGFSEPSAGSDLAALRTQAREAPGGYRLEGHKIWTSWAKWASHCLLLARTGTARGPAPRALGLRGGTGLARRHRLRHPPGERNGRVSPRCSSRTCSCPRATSWENATEDGRSR